MLPAVRGHAPVPLAGLVDRDIARPGRYLGNELGVVPRDWRSAAVRWCLSYPELYEVGASNLGHIILYGILNASPGQLCDRAYLPGPDLGRRLRERQLPLFAVESRRPLAAFDLLGFSLAYELGATNILEMLDLAGLPLRASRRSELPLDHPEAHPLVFAGGPTATSNPEPYAAFLDFVALGDGEELLPEIGLVVAEGKAAGLSRSELLRDLAQVPGVYVPSLYAPEEGGVAPVPRQPDVPGRVLRRVAAPMPHYATGLVPHIETVHDRLTVEIRRGCTRGCRFCQPGMLTRPARDVAPEQVIEAVETGMRRTGYSDFSLLSLSCSDYLALPAVGVELRNRLAESNVSLSLPSQRVDRFDDDIAHILGGTRRTGLTFAPEAGSQRLRDIVNKGLTDEDLVRGIRAAMRNGHRRVKLYFMIGLPGETDGDVLAIADTCRMLQRRCGDLGRLALTITISNFTPKPHTPFQWHSVSTGEFLRRQDLLRQAFRALRGVKANFTDARLSAMEDFVGRGDRRLADVIEAAWRAGAGMDAWFENLERTHAAWTGAIRAAGLQGRYRRHELGTWQLARGLTREDLEGFCARPLPWDHIDTGLDKRWLAEDLGRALEGTVVPDCSFDGCSHCGVCGPDLGHNIIEAPPRIPQRRSPAPPPAARVSRLRFRFAKTGSLALISHLDLMRLLERALRRAALPVSYSGGFHPLPRLQVAQALPLGVEALGEWLDIEFHRRQDPRDALSSLAAQLPEGLTLLEAREVSVGAPSLSQMVSGAVWRWTVRPEPEIAPPDWDRALGVLLGRATLPWSDTDKKGRPRRRECRPYLLTLRRIGPGVGAATMLEMAVRVDAQGRSLRPDQLMHWLGEILPAPLPVVAMTRMQLDLADPSSGAVLSSVSGCPGVGH